MVEIEIVHTPGFNLKNALKERMRLPQAGRALERARKKGLRRITGFVFEDRGKFLRHISPNYPGKIRIEQRSPRSTICRIKFPPTAQHERIIGSFVELLLRHFSRQILEIRVVPAG